MTVNIGYNLTSPAEVETINQLWSRSLISYTELMIDNFFGYDRETFNFLQGPVAFHIMRSRFLEADNAELEYAASEINKFKETLQPLYVSDHLLRFSHNGFRLPYLQEINYDYFNQHPEEFYDLASRWIHLVGGPIYFENAASLDNRGIGQIRFLTQTLSLVPGARLLVDLTNIFISVHNTTTKLAQWEPIISDANIFHIGSYRMSPIYENLMIDSHDSSISCEFKEYLAGIRSLFRRDGESFVTFERDANRDLHSIETDIEWVRDFFEVGSKWI